MSPEHQDLREQLGVYALGHGTEQERAAVTAHLEGCPACRTELAELVPLRARLAGVEHGRLADAPAVPDGLRDAVLGRVAVERSAATSAPAPTTPRRWVVGAAAAALLLAGAGSGYLLRSPEPADLQAVSVQVADARVAATAGIVAHTWGLEVRLQGEGFAAGEVYRMQVTEDDGRSVGAGQFVGIGPGELTCNLSSSVLAADASGFRVVDSSGDLVASSVF